MVEATGIDKRKLREVLDTYHAVEKLGAIVAIPRVSDVEKAAWLKTPSKLLKAGKVDVLVNHIRSLAIGRRAKRIKAHVGYFETNAARMR
jgi:hypothetical protein